MIMITSQHWVVRMKTWMEKLCRSENSKLSYFRPSQAETWAWPWCGHGAESKCLWVFLLSFPQIPSKTLGCYFHLYVSQFPVITYQYCLADSQVASEGLQLYSSLKTWQKTIIEQSWEKDNSFPDSSTNAQVAFITKSLSEETFRKKCRAKFNSLHKFVTFFLLKSFTHC